mgnify:FL=1
MDALRQIDIEGFAGIAFTTHPGPPPQTQWLGLDVLRMDDRYQRPLSQRGRQQIRRIAERFRWSRFAPVIVAPVELYAIIDGQHRCHAARLRNIKSVPCMVVIVDEAEQAEAFTEINTRQLAVRPAVLHKARVTAGDKAALRIQAICDSAGVTIADMKAASDMGRGETLAVNTIYKLAELYGDATLTAALQAIVKAGDGNIGMVRAGIITAYCAVFEQDPLLRDHPDQLDVLDEFDLPAAFARMQATPVQKGALRWRVLATEIEAYLRRTLPSRAA